MQVDATEDAVRQLQTTMGANAKRAGNAGAMVEEAKTRVRDVERALGATMSEIDRITEGSREVETLSPRSKISRNRRVFWP